MSNRLDQDREKELQPKRMEYAKKELQKMGFQVEEKGDARLEFIYKGEKIMLYPYSGWHTGKSIKDGRGFYKLIEQLNP